MIDSRRRAATASWACPVATALLWLATGAAATAASLDLSDFVVTFEDEFKHLDVSANGPGTRWTAHTPWNGDFGDAAFADPGALGPFAAGPDGLTITARKGQDGRWRSGLLCSVDKDGSKQTGFSQQYGYFEIRTRFPEGPGVWPAFWLIGKNKENFSVEIDVFEYYGAFPKGFQTIQHIWENGKDRLDLQHITDIESGFFTSRFNTFGVLIESDRTKFYLNREEIWNTPTQPEYHQPMYILFNLALGGGWPIKDLTSPAVMKVDYVRVWQHKRLLSAPASAPRAAR